MSVSVGDIVTVWISDVDVNKGRIALSMVNSNSINMQNKYGDYSPQFNYEGKLYVKN